MVGKWVISPTCTWDILWIYWGYNPLILTFDPSSSWDIQVLGGYTKWLITIVSKSLRPGVVEPLPNGGTPWLQKTGGDPNY